MDAKLKVAGAGLIVVFALLLALAGLGQAADDEQANLGGANSTGYKFDRQVTVFRSGIAVVDTAATTASDVNLALTPEFGCGGRENLSVSARFSSAGQDCKVRVVKCWKSGSTYYVLGISDEITLTATGLQRSSRYVAPDYVFDTGGAFAAFLIVTDAPGAGTVDFWCGSF